MRDCADGSARLTVKPSPRSAVRGTTTCLVASHWYLSPAFGSGSGEKLMRDSSYAMHYDSVTNVLSFCEATSPLNTSFTLGQLGSFFMVSSQRLTFGYGAKSMPITSPRVTRQAPKWSAMVI